MAPIVHSIEIARPPEEVYSYVTDPSRFPEWQGDVVSGRSAAGPSGVGSKIKTTRRIGRAERTMTQEITELSPPRRWAAHGIDGPVRPDVTLTVDPIEGGRGSRVTFELGFEGHGIGRVLIPLVIRRTAAKAAPVSFQNLKERLEG